MERNQHVSTHLSPLASVAVVLALTCGALAACGSSAGSAGTTTTTTTAAAGGAGTTSATRQAFRNCLKAHGVNLPARRPGSRPPGAGGGFFGGGGLAANPKLRAAFQACGGARFGGGRRLRFSHQTLTAFVTCIRSHGFPAMPDPKLSGGPIFPSSIRTNPKFVAALRSCQSLLRPRGGAPRPGGSA